MKRVCVIQPILSSYSLSVFLELSRYCQVDLIFSPAPDGAGFGKILPAETSQVRYFTVSTVKLFSDRWGIIQWGIAKYILRERPDAIVTSANPRYVTFWTTLLLARLLGIPAYAHGHGIYKKRQISTLYRFMTTALLRLVTSYICYAPMVRQSFIENGFPERKLTVAHNSVINPFPVRPQEKTGGELGILFIGRLRRGNNVGLLVRVTERIRRVEGIPLTLHVIGAGEEAQILAKEASAHPWVVLHGETYDLERIRNVSLNCLLGCYPGNAGLSIVHMMSLSLPVVTHDDLRAHGPEASFIRNGLNGLLYDHKNPETSLYQAIRSLVSEPWLLDRMRQSAFDDYQRLVNPSLAVRLWSIIGHSWGPPQERSAVARSWTRRSSGPAQPETET